jgi:hypothetical protein
MSQAVDESAGEVLQAMADAMRAGIDREIRKLATKTRK